MTQPVVFVWKEVEIVDRDGAIARTAVMVPLPRYGNVCKSQFTLDEEYTLGTVEKRSMASHNHFFAAINEGFKNLPENISARWPTSEHLRKWLLIETGWFDEKEIECASETHARRLQTFVRVEDAYARIYRRGSMVIIRKAKSQSRQAMGTEPFQKSKTDCLDLLEEMVRVPKGTLMREAGRAA